MMCAVLMVRVIVVGYSGSGKSTFAGFLAQDLGATVLNSGDALREVLASRGVPLDNRINTGVVFLREFGEIAAGDAILFSAREKNAVVVEGVRLFSTCQRFLTAHETVLVVFITLSDDIRHERFRERLIKRDGLDESTPVCALAAKDAYSYDIERFRNVADFTFDNRGPLEGLRQFAGEVAEAIRRREGS